MLELRPNCECCDADLAPADQAFICSFECTFCPECVHQLAGICPNCGGELVRRPIPKVIGVAGRRQEHETPGA